MKTNDDVKIITEALAEIIKELTLEEKARVLGYAEGLKAIERFSGSKLT